MDVSEVPHGEGIGDVWDAAIARRVAGQVGVEPAALRVTAARPASGREGDLPPGWTIVAVEHPNGHPMGVLGAYLAERLTRPGTETMLVKALDSERERVIGSSFSLGWTETTLFIIGYEDVPALMDPQADTAALSVVFEAVQEAMTALASFPEWTAPPKPTPAPADEGEPTPAPDPSIEAALPASIEDFSLSIASSSYIRDQDIDRPASSLFTHLLPHFARSGADAALGVASSEGLPVAVFAHRLDGLTGDQLLAAALGELWGNPEGYELYRGAEVDGRRYVFHQDWAFYAQGDVLYFLLYYGGYECTEKACTFGPDAETEKVIRDIVRAIPEAGTTDR